jgi:hypothetical protein
VRINVCYAEPGTLPYLTRKVEPTKVQVSGLAKHLPVGVYPARNTDRVFEPAAHPVENALSVALFNVGPIIHSVLVLLNTGAIEHFGHWDIHNERTTPSVKKLVLAHDAERIELRKALGFRSHHYPFEDHDTKTRATGRENDVLDGAHAEVEANLSLLDESDDVFGVPEIRLPFHLAEAVPEWRTAPIHPVVANSAPSQEVVEKKWDLRDLPAPQIGTEEGGQYLTSSVVIAKDPDTGVRNASIMRCMITGGDRMTCQMDIGRHLRDYYERAEVRG